MLLVADGAGGHDSGDKAAAAAVETFWAEFPEEGEEPDGDPRDWLMACIMKAHALCQSLGSGQARPPASTVVGVLIEKSSLAGWRFHVGDSRLYVRKDQMVAQWTRDHNITNGLIDRGLPVSQAMKIADGGRLTQVLGGGSNPDPEIHGPLGFEPGQTLLVCSDGVYGHNADREILPPALIPETGPIASRSRELKVAVLDGDAPDNLTAVLFEFSADAAASEPRETVTNSMRALSVDEVEEKLAERIRRERGLDDFEPLEDNRKYWVIGAIVLAVVAWFVFFRPVPPAEPAPQPTAAPPVVLEEPELPGEPEPELPGEPGEHEQDETDLDSLIGGFDVEWWNAMPAEEQLARRETLADLMSVHHTRDMVLELPVEMDGPVVSASIVGWMAPGGANADRAATAWAAWNQLRASYPMVAEQPGVSELLREAACAQVHTRWPRRDSTQVGEAVELADWLAGCLKPGSSIKVRLGGWPERGYTLDDLNRLRFLALSGEGGARLLDLDQTDSSRVLELGLLAHALKQEKLAGMAVQIHVIQPTADAPDGATSDDAGVLARSRALEIASLVRSAAPGAQIDGIGTVSDELVADFVDADAGPDVFARLADFARRVEIVVTAK